MNRAVFHRLGLSVGIAIALAGCGQTEANEVRYSIVGYIADGTSQNPRAVEAARAALADGTLTDSEYVHVRNLDDAVSYRAKRKREVIEKWAAQ